MTENVFEGTVKTKDGKYTLVFNWRAVLGFQRTTKVNPMVTFQNWATEAEDVDPDLLTHFTWWALQQHHADEMESEEAICDFLTTYGPEETIFKALMLAYVPAYRDAVKAQEEADAEAKAKSAKKPKAPKMLPKPSTSAKK